MNNHSQNTGRPTQEMVRDYFTQTVEGQEHLLRFRIDFLKAKLALSQTTQDEKAILSTQLRNAEQRLAPLITRKFQIALSQRYPDVACITPTQFIKRNSIFPADERKLVAFRPSSTQLRIAQEN